MQAPSTLRNLLFEANDWDPDDPALPEHRRRWIREESVWYRALHHEPFEPAAAQWSLPPGGPLSMANMTLPWIVFERDRSRFHARIPMLALRRRECFGPWLYLLGGGLLVRQLVRSVLLPVVVSAEALSRPLHRWVGMFMRIVLERQV